MREPSANPDMEHVVNESANTPREEIRLHASPVRDRKCLGFWRRPWRFVAYLVATDPPPILRSGCNKAPQVRCPVLAPGHLPANQGKARRSDPYAEVPTQAVVARGGNRIASHALRSASTQSAYIRLRYDTRSTGGRRRTMSAWFGASI